MALTAGTWQIEDSRIGMQPIATADTVQNHPLGTIVRAKDVGSTAYGQGEFVYVKGVSSGAAKAWAIYNADDYTTTLAVADGIGPMGVMMSTLDASTKFGWLQISGKALGKCLTLFADNGIVYLTSTPGSIDDASVIGDVVHLAKGASTAVVGNLHAEFEIHRPFAENRVSLTN
jgi:hypothetical protein